MDSQDKGFSPFPAWLSIMARRVLEQVFSILRVLWSALEGGRCGWLDTGMNK